MKAVNLTQNSDLAETLAVASTFWSSLVGLLGKRALPGGHGLWLVPCQSVHTLGMRFPIDVVFLDKQKKVIHLVENMKSYRLSRHLTNARSVLELPAFTITATRTKLGDQIAIAPD